MTRHLKFVIFQFLYTYHLIYIYIHIYIYILYTYRYMYSGPSRSSFDLSCADELSKSETAAVRRLILYNAP